MPPVSLPPVLPETPLSLVDLPPELIHYILSFLPISVCVALLRYIPPYHVVGKLLHRSVYERSIFYGNHYLQNMTRWWIHDTSIKQLSTSELIQLIHSEADNDFCIIPRHFVVKYTYDFYPSPEYNQLNVLRTFVEALRLLTRYFELIHEVELQMDLCNKHPACEGDNYEIRHLAQILASRKLDHNLTKIHLKRFQRAGPDGIAMTRILESNIHRFHNLNYLSLDSSRISDISNMHLPRSLTCILFINNRLTHLPKDPAFFPPNLLTLNLSCNNIPSLEGVHLPKSLQFLDIQLNCIRKLSDVKWPENLRVLIVSGNELQLCEERIEFPLNLQILNLLQNPNIISFSGLKFPSTLRRIFIDVTFEKLPIDVPRKDLIIYA